MPTEAMIATSAIKGFLITGLLFTQPQFAVQTEPVYALPDDPAEAWAEVLRVHQALRPPDDWQAKPPNPEHMAAFQQEVCKTANAFADKAREFIHRFPTSEHIADARITVVHALTHAVAAGDADAEARIQSFTAKVLADETIPEDDRVGVLMYAGNAAFMRNVGMRLFTEGMAGLWEEFETASIENTRAALKLFPENAMLHTMLVATAQRATGERQRELATEVFNAPGAPPGAKTLAQHILKATKPYEVGQPLDIRFTALDGRDVDLAKMKGKVVLVEFWSTTCGPCIAGIPEVKSVYEKLRDHGFEVVGIALDQNEAALRRFIEQREVPWPQHFDGGGWQNEFAVRYGIFSLPTKWLVDTRGNLRDTNARFDLERRVANLLAERDSQSR